MQLKSICIKNFRRLNDVKIDVTPQTTIFVGANNSGKTSATHILKTFLDGKNDFSLYDFSAGCWERIDAIGKSENIQDDIFELPKITLDLWFTVDESDLSHIIDLLPSLDWEGTPVGVRLEYAPINSETLLFNFSKVLSESKKKKKDDFQPWPTSLTDYLVRKLKNEYKIHYYVLDHSQFDEKLNELEHYSPLKLGDENERTGAKIIRSILKIDFLNAQRHLSDTEASARAEDLSKRLNRFYERNLEKKDDDINAMRALFNSETELTHHLALVFEPTLKNINKLGYPGFTNPQLIIKATLNFESINRNAKLHYGLGKLELPDKYNGLGFKNLIYMVIEILDFHERWKEEKDNRPPLHLILIEEPEAHLHAQLQQVFIRQIWNIILGSDAVGYNSQLILTTHSPHIIYESGFQPIRYFHRCVDADNNPTSQVLNLSTFYGNDKDESKDFLQRYMKLIHCDLFFADAVILVEGNVERLLLPLMVEKCAPELQTNYLSVIEVGGAYAYRFKELVEFLGLTTLIITDIDSVSKEIPALVTEIEAEEIDNLEGAASKSACMVDSDSSETSNLTLINWIPKLNVISELLSATNEQKTQDKSSACTAIVHICYQSRISVVWKDEKLELVGRTLEEAFALQNLSWCQDETKKFLGLKVTIKSRDLTLVEIHEKIFKRVKSSGFKKTDFALGVLSSNPDEWEVPEYISSGLRWLADEISNNPALTVEVAVIETETAPIIVVEAAIDKPQEVIAKHDK